MGLYDDIVLPIDWLPMNRQVSQDDVDPWTLIVPICEAQRCHTCIFADLQENRLVEHSQVLHKIATHTDFQQPFEQQFQATGMAIITPGHLNNWMERNIGG